MLSWKEHLIFWVITLLFFATTIYAIGIPIERALYSKLFFLPFQLIGAYFMIFVLLGKLLYQNKYLKAILSFIVFIFLYSFLVYYVHDYYFRTAIVDGFTPPTFLEMVANFELLISYYMNFSLTSPLILVCIEFIMYQYKRIVEVEQLQIKKNEAELNLLKTQIHPNFLLSTLRNLEVLAKNNSEKSPLVVEKLSEVLDYILYKGQYENVRLEDEMKAIEDFVDLENIRFDGRCEIDLKLNTSDGNVLVSPLIIFSFLEYNFKQFTLQHIPFEKCIIEMKQVDGKLIIDVSNSMFQTNSFDGIYNYEIGKMTRQLEISYPGKYIIEEIKNEDAFKIKLEIDL